MNVQRAGIALGSNLGNRLAIFRAARDQIFALEGMSSPFLQSSIFETEPVDCEPGAASFYNAVIEVGYARTAQELLAAIRGIELQMGRPGQHVRNESRVIDLDLLYLGEMTGDTSVLELPHPRMRTRRFVLAPLAEIRGVLRLPNQTNSVSELLENLQDPAAVTRILEKW